MPQFSVNFPSSTMGYLCTSFFSLAHSSTVQEYNESKLIEPGSNSGSLAEILQRTDVPILFDSKAQASFRRMTQSAMHLDYSTTVSQYLSEVKEHLEPLKLRSPKKPFRPLRNVGRLQNYQPYALHELSDSLLLPEPLIIHKDALSFFHPVNFLSKTPPFIAIHDPLEAVGPVQQMKPCPLVRSPHVSSLKTHIEPDETLPISPPDITTGPLLFFEPRNPTPSFSATVKSKSAPISVVKPTFSTEKASELSPTVKESQKLADGAPEVFVETEQTSLPLDDPLEISFSDWDDFIIDQILEAEEVFEMDRLTEQTPDKLKNVSDNHSNGIFVPEREKRVVQEDFVCQGNSLPQKSLEDIKAKEKIISGRTVESAGTEPIGSSKLKAFMNKRNSQKVKKTDEEEELHHYRKGKQNPSIEDLVIIEVPTSRELLRCLSILETAGSPLLKELQQKKIKLSGTFALIRPEHTRALVQQVYQYRKSKTFSRSLTRDDDRLYGVVMALHGLVKTADVILNCGMNEGVSTLKTFQASYAKNFGFNQWVEILISSLVTSQDKKDLPHPKLLQLCRIVEQYEVYRGRVVVVFPRFMRELQHVLKEILAEKKVSCSLWEDQRKSDIYLLSTSNTMRNIPASKIALVIHYEDPPFKACGIKQLVLRAIWSGCKVSPLPETQKRGKPQRLCESKTKPLTGTCNPVLEEQELLKAVLGDKKSPILSEKGSKPTELHCGEYDGIFEKNYAQFDLQSVCKNLREQNSVPQHPNLPLIIDKRLLAQLEDAFVLLESKLSCTVYDCDYSFAHNDPTVRLSQPDIICDGFTCIIVTNLEDDSVFERVLKLQPKCSTLWVLLWSPKLTQHKLATFVSFAQFVNNKTPGFRLKWHSASSQASLAAAVEKTAAIAWQENVERGVEPWKEFNLDDNPHWQSLVRLPCFHAYSAWLLLHRTSYQTLFHVGLEYLISTYPEIPSTVLKMFYDMTHREQSSRPAC